MTRQGTTAGIASTAIAALILVVVVPTMLVNRAVLWWSLLILLGVAAAIGAVVGGVRLLRWGRRGQLVLAGGILAVAMAVVAVLSYQGVQYGGAPSTTTVTVPVISTAKLVDDDHWDVTHTMTLPEGTRAPRELGNGFGNEWALVEVVDKHPIYVQTVEVPVDLSKFDTSTSAIDAPGAPDPSRDVYYAAADGSTITLLTPRDAVFGTTPTSGGAQITADLKVSATEVEYGRFDDTIDVGMAGTWARGPLWSKVYTLASYGWWSLATAALLGVLLFLGRRVLAATGEWLWDGVSALWAKPDEPDAGGPESGGDAATEEGDRGADGAVPSGVQEEPERSGLGSSRADTGPPAAPGRHARTPAAGRED